MNYIEEERLLSQDLTKKDWIGEVVDNKDPETQFRCKIKVFGLFDELEPEQIPWAFPACNSVFAGKSGGYGCGSTPKVGSLVKVRFNSGSLYAPEYYAIQNINSGLQGEISGDYEGTHVLLYDEDEELSVIYQKSSGFKIHLKGTELIINPDSSLNLTHKDSQSTLEFKGGNITMKTTAKIDLQANNEVNITSQVCNVKGMNKTQIGPLGNMSAVGAEPLWAFLTALAGAVDAKAPQSPGAMTGLVQSAKLASTSNNVKISVP